MTLILSSSDFAIYHNGALDNTLTGSAQLHSLIDSATNGYDSGSLPSSSYCRRYVTADQGAVSTSIVLATVSSSVDGGAYSGSWGDNAISVRAWVRKTGLNSMHLTLKSFGGGAQATHPTGYSIYYANNGFMSIYAATDPGFGGDNTDNVTSIRDLAVDSDKWHRIRLDYIPVSTIYDKLNFYTASAGGTNTETWELIDTLDILPGDGWYVGATTSSAIGYSVDDYTDAKPIYIDDFQVYVTPVG